MAERPCVAQRRWRQEPWKGRPRHIEKHVKWRTLKRLPRPFPILIVFVLDCRLLALIPAASLTISQTLIGQHRSVQCRLEHAAHPRKPVEQIIPYLYTSDWLDDIVKENLPVRYASSWDANLIHFLSSSHNSSKWGSTLVCIMCINGCNSYGHGMKSLGCPRVYLDALRTWTPLSVFPRHLLTPSCQVT